jgi:hypothetical protein
MIQDCKQGVSYSRTTATHFAGSPGDTQSSFNKRTLRFPAAQVEKLMTRHKPRPRIQRTFIHWLEKNQSRFMVPVRIKRITAERVDMDFVGVTQLIGATLYHWGGATPRCYEEITVPVNWDGTHWDLLLWLDAAPVKSGDGYVCRSCEMERQAVFQDRESLWQDHLFEPFLNWVNTSLAPAKWLELGGSDDRGCTYATILTEKPGTPSPEHIYIPIRDESLINRGRNMNPAPDNK